MASDCEQLFELKSPFTEGELKKKYKDLAKKNHPDMFQDPTLKERAHETFLRIGLCKDLLKSSINGQDIKNRGKYNSAPMAGKDWTIFEEYIVNLKQDPDKNVVWNTHIDGDDPSFQEPINPLSSELKQDVPFDLYTHQAEALNHYRKGENLVLVTPTASGKSLGYMLPFFEQVTVDPKATAIFIFPMKALAYDQFANFERLTDGKVSQAVFDGDTDDDIKKAIRKNPPNVLYTNPDELHHSILYTSEKWQNFFKNLKLIVLDEIHIYKGSFGSNVSNVIERLLFIVKAAGADPQIVCTSATISKPLPFAERLAHKKFHLINKSGAGGAEKYLVMVEPVLDEDRIPLITPPSIAVQEALELASHGHQVIVFVNSRSEADVLANHARYLLENERGPQPTNAENKDNVPAQITPEQIVSGYHAGYSSKVRRDIESRIKSGLIKIVFSTNALELGVDIGTLDVCILLGIPPTNNEIWQRIGRAGRNQQNPAMVLMINNFTAFDWYHFSNPQNFISSRNKPDRPIIDPLNAETRKLHLNCAHFEGMQARHVKDKANWKAIDKKINKWWAYHRIQIRGGNPDPYVLENETGKSIGEIDYDRAYRDLYPGALYELDGRSYKYKHRDFKKRVFTLQTLLHSDEFTTPFVEMDVSIDEVGAQECVLNYGELSLIAGHGKMEIDKIVQGYNLRHKLFPEFKQFYPIKYPDKWPTEKVTGFWLSIAPGAEKAWKKYLDAIPDTQPYSLFIILHTIEHLIIKATRERGFCDWSDLGGASSEFDPHASNPAAIIYETQQRGIGLAKAMFENIEGLLNDSLDLLNSCPCENGCPACTLTPSFCIERYGFLDKELAKVCLIELLKVTPTRTSFSRGKSDSDEVIAVPRDIYSEGDIFKIDWVVHELTDEGIIVQNKDGDIRLHYYEDIPL